MGIFDDIGSARINQDGDFARPGKYIGQVVEIVQGNGARVGDYVAVRLKILHVFAFEMNVAPEGQPPRWQLVPIEQYNKELKLDNHPHRVGDVVTVMYQKKFVTFASAVKTMVFQLSGCAPHEITAASMDEVVGKTQPFSGFVTMVAGKTIITKEQKKPFTKVSYGQQMTEEEFTAVTPDDVPLPDDAVWRPANVAANPEAAASAEE